MDLSQEVWKHWTIEKSFRLQRSVVYSKPFTTRIWRTTTQAHALLEVPGTAPIIVLLPVVGNGVDPGGLHNNSKKVDK